MFIREMMPSWTDILGGLMGKKAASELESKGIYFKDPAKAAKDTIKRMKKKVMMISLI